MKEKNGHGHFLFSSVKRRETGSLQERLFRHAEELSQTSCSFLDFFWVSLSLSLHG
jgi:hypothetical protein